MRPVQADNRCSAQAAPVPFVPMPPLTARLEADLHRRYPPNSGVSVGLDTVTLEEVASAWRAFGERYARRLFSPAECAYALQEPARVIERLAARFAAKEAAIKALNLGEAGVNWRDIEVRRSPDGSPHLALHGRALEALASRPACELALSLAHDPIQACAVVLAIPSSHLCSSH